MQAVARDLGCPDAASCMQALMAGTLNRSQAEILAGHLAIGETYFFREKPVLDVLQNQILPELIARRRQSGQLHLRIWSAGCCTGEEPYSIAILLSRLLPDIRNWNIAVLGTDINPHFLRKARRGAYTEWSFRSPPLWLQRDYFRSDSGGRFEILPAVKALVDFAYHNLAEDACPSLVNHTNGMDVIFCRNVLMYFAPQGARRVVANLYRCLVDGGWLVVSPTEASAALLEPFQAIHFPEAVLFRKGGSEAFPTGLPTLPSLQCAGYTGFGLELPSNFQPAAWPIAAPEPETLPAGVPNTADAMSAAPVANPRIQVAQLYEQGRYDDAEKILSGMLAAEQADAKALALLARIHANRGRLAEALEWCDRALREDRLDPAAHYLKANILVEQGRFEEATAGFRRVIYLDPRFPLAYFALGNLCKREGKFAEAARHFANVLELLGGCDPDSVVPEAEGLTAGRLREIIQAGRECLA